MKEKNEVGIKIRLTTDASISGINGAAMVPGFSYPSVHDAVMIIEEGDYLWKGDVVHAASNIGIDPRYTLQITGTQT